MKKVCLFMLVLALAGSMVFAQITISGSVRAKGVYATEQTGGSGWYGLGDGFSIINDNSRIQFTGSYEGKAGVVAQLRLGTVAGASDTKPYIFMKNFHAWAQPVNWFKVNLGWMDIADYVIQDTTGTIAFDGNMRNTGKMDPLGGLDPNFGALVQFTPLDGNLNIGVALTNNGQGNFTTPENMWTMLAVMYKIPNIGKLVVDFQMKTTTTNTADFIRSSATFQYQSKQFDLAVGLKYNGSGFNSGQDKEFSKLVNPGSHQGQFNVMALFAIKPIEKLAINVGLEGYFLNGGGLADTISVSYDFGVIKPLFYAYGFTAFDTTQMRAKAGNWGGGSVQTSQVIGAELNIPFKVGKASVLAAGIAYDIGVQSFQIPVFFRLFF